MFNAFKQHFIRHDQSWRLAVVQIISCILFIAFLLYKLAPMNPEAAEHLGLIVWGWIGLYQLVPVIFGLYIGKYTSTYGHIKTPYKRSDRPREFWREIFKGIAWALCFFYLAYKFDHLIELEDTSKIFIEVIILLAFIIIFPIIACFLLPRKYAMPKDKKDLYPLVFKLPLLIIILICQ